MKFHLEEIDIYTDYLKEKVTDSFNYISKAKNVEHLEVNIVNNDFTNPEENVELVAKGIL